MTIRDLPFPTNRASLPALFAVLAVLSCGETAAPPVVATVQLSPPSATLTALGDSIQLVAVVLDQDGQTMMDAPVIWSSANGSVANVDAGGLVTALGNGVTTIEATAGSVSEKASIVVLQQILAIDVTPASDTVEVGEPAQFLATARDANARPVADAQIIWRSSNPLVAVVDQTGVVQGRSAGNATISAAANNVTGAARVTVEALVPETVTISPSSSSIASLGRSAQLAAVVYDRHGRVMDGVNVVWSSSNAGVATVNAGGLVTARANGTTTITARSGPASASADITVAQQVASVTVSPPALTLAEGESSSLVATATDANNRQVAGAVFQWASTRPSVATVDQTGVVTGAGEGAAAITASSGGLVGTSNVTVEGPPVASLTISPVTASLFRIGATVQLRAVARDARNHVLTNVDISWSTRHSGIATVSATGLVTATGLGTTRIDARAGTQTASASVTVSRPVARVDVSPATRGLAIGDSVQLSAVARDANGNILADTPFTWASANTAVATVSDRGIVRGVSAGTAVIIAESNGRTGSATITVSKSGTDPGSATVIAMGDSATATVPAGGEHLYEVTVPALRGRTTVRLTAWTEGTSDTQGFLYDAKDKELANDDDGGAGSNFLISHEGSPGKYYVKVTGYRGAQATYKLKVDDHGDGIDTATPASDGQTPGHLHVNGNVDYFRISVGGTARQSVVVQTTGSTDTYGQLLTSTGSIQAQDDDGGTGNNFRIGTTVSPGTYYVRVAGYQNERTGSYVLVVGGTDTGGGGGGGSGSNSNSTRATATTVQWGGSVSDAFQEDNQTDYFIVNVPRSSRATIRLIAHTEGSTNVAGRLERLNGNRITSEDSPSGSNFKMIQNVTPNTFYFIRVTGQNANERGSYTLKVDDHGDTRESATYVVLTSGRGGEAGSLVETNNVDYFEIDVPSSTDTTRVLTVSTTGATDTYGELYISTSGVRLKADDNGAADSRNFTIRYALPASGSKQTYYVRVTGARNSSGEYTLAVDMR